MFAHVPSSHKLCSLLILCLPSFLQTYTVVSTKSDGSTQEVFRAFSTFVELEDQISALKLESSVSLPKIPLPGYFRSLTPDELEVGRALLEAYLKRLIKIPTVNEFMFFRSFLKPTDREDWPSLVGPIDLNKHDLPHASSATEWWYYNCHFTAGGNTYSAFVCFFRKLKHTDEKTGKKTFAHALNWAVTDVDRSEYVSETILDKDTPEIVKVSCACWATLTRFHEKRLYRKHLRRVTSSRTSCCAKHTWKFWTRTLFLFQTRCSLVTPSATKK